MVAPKIETIARGPSQAHRLYLKRGLQQAGGKLPLFDHAGQQISTKTIKHCIAQGWAELWFENPIKPDWLVCRLTERGRDLLLEEF
jgi:hypothetical protein